MWKDVKCSRISARDGQKKMTSCPAGQDANMDFILQTGLE
jgi:hypothetical protein